jgi:hypothetical protein
MPQLLVVKRLKIKQTPYAQLRTIMEGEGTISGVYNIHETIFKERLDYKVPFPNYK